MYLLMILRNNVICSKHGMHIYISVIHKGSIFWLDTSEQKQAHHSLCGNSNFFYYAGSELLNALPQLSVMRADLYKHL